jgi:hypothetical protein
MLNYELLIQIVCKFHDLSNTENYKIKIIMF